VSVSDKEPTPGGVTSKVLPVGVDGVAREFNEEERERIRRMAEVCRATPVYDGALTEPLFPGLTHGSKK